MPKNFFKSFFFMIFACLIQISSISNAAAGSGFLAWTADIHSLHVEAASKCKRGDRRRICVDDAAGDAEQQEKIEENAENEQNEENEQEEENEQKEENAESEEALPKERACPPGYVVLETPNKYGAFCEPREGFPTPAPQEAETPAPQEAEKCKFPGEIRNAANECICPRGTEFMGFRGCLKKQSGCIDIDAFPAGTGDSFKAECEADQGLFSCEGRECCCAKYE